MVMRVAGEEMRMAVLRNASEEAGLTLHREIASTSQIRVREIERAQLRIVEVLNKQFGEGQALEAVVG
jgi:flagellar motor switch protein FliG